MGCASVAVVCPASCWQGAVPPKLQRIEQRHGVDGVERDSVELFRPPVDGRRRSARDDGRRLWEGEEGEEGEEGRFNHGGSGAFRQAQRLAGRKQRTAVLERFKNAEKSRGRWKRAEKRETIGNGCFGVAQTHITIARSLVLPLRV